MQELLGPQTSFAEVAEAMGSLIKAGKILALALPLALTLPLPLPLTRRVRSAAGACVTTTPTGSRPACTRAVHSACPRRACYYYSTTTRTRMTTLTLILTLTPTLTPTLTLARTRCVLQNDYSLLNRRIEVRGLGEGGVRARRTEG